MAALAAADNLSALPADAAPVHSAQRSSQCSAS